MIILTLFSALVTTLSEIPYPVPGVDYLSQFFSHIVETLLHQTSHINTDFLLIAGLWGG